MSNDNTKTEAARNTLKAFLAAQTKKAEAEKALAVADAEFRKVIAETEKAVGATSGDKIAYLCKEGIVRHFSPVRNGFAFKKFLPGWTTDGKTVVDVSDLV